MLRDDVAAASGFRGICDAERGNDLIGALRDRCDG